MCFVYICSQQVKQPLFWVCLDVRLLSWFSIEKVNTVHSLGLLKSGFMCLRCSRDKSLILLMNHTKINVTFMVIKEKIFLQNHWLHQRWGCLELASPAVGCLWEWKESERRREVRGTNSHRGIQTSRRRRFCWTSRRVTNMMTAGFRRTLWRGAEPHRSEQGTPSVPLTSALHLMGHLLLPLLAPLLSCHAQVLLFLHYSLNLAFCFSLPPTLP